MGGCLRSFSRKTMKMYASAAGIVIDLRDNHGGSPFSTARMLAELLPSEFDRGYFVSRKGMIRETPTIEIFTGDYGGSIVVLVDEASYSSAEIFAHVMQHNKRATIVGRRTKGYVLGSQEFKLPDRGRILIPLQDYIGADGQRLEGRGVTPDINVPEPTLADLRAKRDPDLEMALKILRNSDNSPALSETR